ncbi:MAG: type II secretion system F family protein [Candidatus Odinarchaeota archaeon]
MPRVKKSTFQIGWAVSIVLSVAVLLYTFITMYIPYIQFLADNPLSVEGKSIGNIVKDPIFYFFDIVDLTFIGLILLFFLPGYLYRKDFRWRNAADNSLPDFLREIGDAQKVGLPLPRAVVEASKREYGPLTEELRFMASKMSWGVGFHESLLRMKKRINTRLFDRTSVLILEAERSGGSIEDVFEAAHNHVSELLAVKRERAAAMQSYTWIIYAAYVVFAFVMVILLISFFATMATQSMLFAGSEVESTINIVNIAALELLFFHMLMIQGSFSGIVAGKMGSGDAYLGLTHNIVLLTIGYLIYKIMVIII